MPPEAAMPPMSINTSSSREWLETDGLGGFASGSVAGIRTRRYHALLLTATTPPTGRLVLVNGFDAWVETAGGRFDLSSQWYSPGVLGGTGAAEYREFLVGPWPTWVFKFADDTRIQQEIFLHPRRTGHLHRMEAALGRRDIEAHGTAVSVGPRLPCPASKQSSIPL